MRKNRRKHVNGGPVVIESLEPRTMLSAAPDIVVSADYVTSYTSSMAPLGALDFSNPASRNPTYWHKIEIRVKAENFAPGQDLWAVSFNIGFGAGLTRNTASWQAYNPQFDSDGDGVNDSSLYYTNGDAGTPNDYQGILVIVMNNVANNRQIGQAGRPKAGGPCPRTATAKTWSSRSGTSRPGRRR